MLYVFHVDAGQMTTYDMSLTLQSVACLRAAIERKTKIPATSLVLLVSGGEVLQNDHMVSSYSAGTDTNPIYMFSKPSVKENHLKQSMCSDLSPIVELSTGEFRSDTRSAFDGKSFSELKAAVEMCCAMQPTVHTVIKCANLAQQFSDLGHEVTRSCDTLVHEQHLQHQGWAAVVANLEDIFNEFCERSKNFKESFRKHRLKKEEYHQSLNTLNEVLESLGKIPILPALQVNAEAHRFSAFDVFEENDFVAQHCSSQPLDNSGEKTVQDFGVEVFKLSEEDVFEQKEPSGAQASGGPSSDKPLEDSYEGVTFKAQSYEKDEPTLLHWILAQGNKASLQDILDYCQKGLALIDAEPLKEHEAELYHILEYANMHGLKQIKGIEERLYGLEQLLAEVKKLEKDQHDQAASLIQYRDRLNSACDPSVLPTLVQSHWCQLEKLLKGHQTLVDIRRRIAKSKDELSHILKARLEMVLVIENSMSVQDAHAMLSFQCFGRLSRYLTIVEQLHQAPGLFVRALHEVARRRAFSTKHLKWATDLASKLLKIHEEEIARRQEFNSMFEGHFLKSLFPGMTELPPPFATQAPPVFDARLPAITETDVELIRSSFPQLTEGIPKYDMKDTVSFFEQRLAESESDGKDGEEQNEKESDAQIRYQGVEEVTVRQTADVSTTCVAETTAVSTVTEVRDINFTNKQTLYNNESFSNRETENKLDNSVIAANTGTAVPGNNTGCPDSTHNKIRVNIHSGIPHSNSTPVMEQRGEFVNSEFYIEESLPTSLDWGRDDGQDNMDTHKINVNRLQDFLIQLCGLCRVSLVFIREEIDMLKREVNSQKLLVREQYEKLLELWRQSNDDADLRFREATQRLTVDHELELSDMKATLDKKDETIAILKKEKAELLVERQKEIERLEKEHQDTKDLLEKTKEDIAAFDKKLEEIEEQKQKDIKDLQEKMHQDYKAEIEAFRTRFRLVALTNTDRSPSESSLEKIERTDVIEISSHNAIVMQTKENAEVEKEEAVKQAVTELQQKYEAEIAALKADKQLAINEATRRLLSEKDKQIDILREREQVLMKESSKYRDTIQQLTDPETNDYDSLLKTQMATLENEKALLQQQVQDLKKELEKKSEETITDKSSKEDDSDGRSSPSRKERPRWHTPVGLSAGTLSLSSCLAGHHVLLLWEPRHHNYIVLQEASIMYFVHSACLPALDLSIDVKNEDERKLYAVATVESKEYCYAKKSGNRFRMPRGSRFYRVKVRPHRPALPPPACCDHSHKHDAPMPPPLSVLAKSRPLKKWLTYMHAPDMQKSVDVSQSISSAAEESKRDSSTSTSGQEVATATLINLESPVPAGEAAASTSAPAQHSEDQLDSIESSDQWQVAKMQLSTISTATDMECSVGRVLGPEPLELTGAVAAVARGPLPPGSELAEEAAP